MPKIANEKKKFNILVWADVQIFIYSNYMVQPPWIFSSAYSRLRWAIFDFAFVDSFIFQRQKFQFSFRMR